MRACVLAGFLVVFIGSLCASSCSRYDPLLESDVRDAGTRDGAEDGGAPSDDGNDAIDEFGDAPCTDIASIPVDPTCDGIDCSGHGRCFAQEGEPVCNCHPGYYNSSPTECRPDDSPGICNQEGWCWQNPRPQGNHLNAVWGTGEDDLWMVGKLGTIIHWDGVSWSLVPSGTDSELTDIWGTSSIDIWAVGKWNNLLHWDGSTWSSVESGIETRWVHSPSVWGTAPDDVWAVGDNIVHWDGVRWSEVAIEGIENFKPRDVCGLSGDDVWFVGGYLDEEQRRWVEVFSHWDGSTWTILRNDTQEGFYHLRCIASDDVWAVGYSCRIAHWDGEGLTYFESPDCGPYEGLQGIWSSASDDVWAVGRMGRIIHWDGSTWSRSSSYTMQELFDVWGASSDSVWAVGKYGTILHWNGKAWSSIWTGNSLRHGLLYDVCSASPDDAWAVGEYGLSLHWNGSRWTEVSNPYFLSNTALAGVWGADADDVWVVGSNEAKYTGEAVILHWDGITWADVPSNVSSRLNGIWGASFDDIWAVGESNAVIHWDGCTWSEAESPASGSDMDLYAVHGSDSADVWAVGNRGTALHWDGRAWSEVDTGFSALDVWAAATDDVWAVDGACSEGGCGGLITHFDGNEWSEVQFDDELYKKVPFSAVWGTSSMDVWAAGYPGILLHWNGNAWSEASAFSPEVFFGISGTASSDIWAVGFGSLHWDGMDWSGGPGNDHWWNNDSWKSESLNDVWGTTSEAPDGTIKVDVWAVGNLGTIVHSNGSTWSTVPSPTTQQLLGVWGAASDDVWAVGTYGTTFHYNGSYWSHVPNPVYAKYVSLEGVWGSASDDVWAVGFRWSPGDEQQVIIHWDGDSWSLLEREVPGRLRDVWGSAYDDVWAVGDRGTEYILHWDGSTWSNVENDTGLSSIRSVWGTASDDVWISGGRRMGHWDGNTWSVVPDVTVGSLYGLGGTAADDVWTVGRDGFFHWDGLSWTSVTRLTDRQLNALWAMDEHVWVVGDEGTILHHRRWSSTIEWIEIPGGTFMMGSDAPGAREDEQPVHQVTVPSFEMNRTEVTVAQYRECVNAGACTEPKTNVPDLQYCNWGYPDRGYHPVNCVEWDQAVDFCTWAGGRLPTEAEWEYAARGCGQDITYPWGDETATCDHAVMDEDNVWNNGNEGCGEERTWSVCSKVSGNTSQGLCDMSGNVFEWVQDWYHGSYDCVANPCCYCFGGGVAPSDGSAWEDPSPWKVMRGGAWNYNLNYWDNSFRASHRSAQPTYPRIDCGFRCAR